MNRKFQMGKKSKLYGKYKKDSCPTYENDFANSTDINSLYGNLFDKKEREMKKIMSIIQKGGTQDKTIGISYSDISSEHDYSSTDPTVIYTGDYSLYDLDSLELFLSNQQPHLILIHCPGDSKLKEIFKSGIYEKKIKYIQYLNIQFNQLSGILEIYFSNQLNIPNVNVYSKVGEIIDGLSNCGMSALYTIINIVLKAISHSSISYYETRSCPLITFERIPFQEMALVSKKTQREIKIFEEKLHPSLVKGQGRSKEGLSLFSLFNKCITNQGKKLMKNIFQYPLQNERKITQRLDTISDFISLKNYLTIKSLVSELKNIRDLEKLIMELQKFMINFKIWNGLYYTFCSVIKIFEIFKTQMIGNISNTHGRFKLLANIFTLINHDNIEKVFDFLSNCLDFIKDEIRPKIKPGINEDLDMLRKEFNDLDAVLSQHAIEYSKKIPKDSFMEKFMFVFLPQLGYMLAVEKSTKYYLFLKKVIREIQISKNSSERLMVNLSSNSIQSEISKTNIEDINNFSNTNPNAIKPFQKNTDVIEEDAVGEEKFTGEVGLSCKENSKECGNKVEEINEECLKAENNNNGNESGEENEAMEEIQNYEETSLLQKIVFEDLKITFQFHSDDMVYFKNEVTAGLDSEYGDLAARITDIENAIFREISKQILEFEKDILLTNEFISNLDVFLHFFIIAEKYFLSRPDIVQPDSISHNPKKDSIIIFSEKKEEFDLPLMSNNKSSVISVIDGRNILNEIATEHNYIKSSFNSEDKSIIIISGNISSGKSVFIRMIGLLVYLTQIGAYVPAKSFRLEIFNKIFTNIEIFESSLDHMSGFTIEVKELKYIIDKLEKELKSDDANNFNDLPSCSNSLVLLDDPFKKTSLHNKNCLLGGAITFISKLIKNRPKGRNAILFIAIPTETKDFLIEQEVLDFSITAIYEMKTEAIKCEKGDKFINLFELKKSASNNTMKETASSDGMKLFLAKEQGLDNQLFLRSLEIFNILNSNQQLYPDVKKLTEVVERFKRQRNLFKLGESVLKDDIIERINNL